MRRVTRMIIATTMVLAVVVTASIRLDTAYGSATPATRVVVVLAPYLTWQDIASVDAPNLNAIASDGAVGNLNVSNRNRSAAANSSAQGSLTLSAGSWAAADGRAPSAYSAHEYYEGGTAADAFERMTGIPAQDDEVLFLGMPRTQRLNEKYETLDVVVGTLGEAVVEAGGLTAALGNSDSGYEAAGIWRNRPAALVAMDEAGRVPLGDVSTDLLATDYFGPFGLTTDIDRFGNELSRLDQVFADSDAPGLLVLDGGDLQRAHDFAFEVADSVAERHHAAAVSNLDAIVGMITESMPDDGVVMVIPPIAQAAEDLPMGLAPVIVYGEGWSGYLSSSSTQRVGLVTNLDVAATVLDLLGIETPTHVLGNPMVSDADQSALDDQIGGLVELDQVATAIDAAKRSVLNGYITVTTLVLLLATFVLLRGRRWSHGTVRIVSGGLNVALLGVLAVPPATTLMFLLDGSPTTPGQAATSFVVMLMALWVLALLLARFAPLRISIAMLSLLAASTLLVDQWLGAPLSFSSFLGYSPLLAARYYGLGNEGAALLMGALLVGVAFVFDQYPDARWTSAGRMWGVPILGAVMVVTSAAPFLGANVGVAIWGVVGFAVLWALMNDKRITWQLVAVSGLAVVALVAAFSVIDLAAGDGAQTHLGRAWKSATSGGWGELWLIIVRKVETNLRVLTHTNWSYLLVAILGFLGFMRWRPQGDFAATLDDNTHFSAAIAAGLVGGAAAYVTEDSGIVIPALIMLYVGVGILYLMLARLASTSADVEVIEEGVAHE